MDEFFEEKCFYIQVFGELSDPNSKSSFQNDSTHSETKTDLTNIENETLVNPPVSQNLIQTSNDVSNGVDKNICKIFLFVRACFLRLKKLIFLMFIAGLEAEKTLINETITDPKTQPQPQPQPEPASKPSQHTNTNTNTNTSSSCTLL